MSLIYLGEQSLLVTKIFLFTVLYNNSITNYRCHVSSFPGNIWQKVTELVTALFDAFSAKEIRDVNYAKMVTAF